MHRHGVLRPPEYEAAYRDFFDRAFDAELGTYPLMRRVDRIATRHKGPVRTVFASPWDRAPTVHEFSLVERFDWVRSGDFAQYALFVRALAEKAARNRYRDAFRTLAEGATAAGRMSTGIPLSWEAILQAMDQLPPSFDAEGRPLLPELWTGPRALEQLAGLRKPEDFDERLSVIISKKREEWHATKRSRRIPRGD